MAVNPARQHYYKLKFCAKIRFVAYTLNRQMWQSLQIFIITAAEVICELPNIITKKLSKTATLKCWTWMFLVGKLLDWGFVDICPFHDMGKRMNCYKNFKSKIWIFFFVQKKSTWLIERFFRKLYFNFCFKIRPIESN